MKKLKDYLNTQLVLKENSMKSIIFMIIKKFHIRIIFTIITNILLKAIIIWEFIVIKNIINSIILFENMNHTNFYILCAYGLFIILVSACSNNLNSSFKIKLEGYLKTKIFDSLLYNNRENNEVGELTTILNTNIKSFTDIFIDSFISFPVRVLALGFILFYTAVYTHIFITLIILVLIPLILILKVVNKKIMNYNSEYIDRINQENQLIIESIPTLYMIKANNSQNLIIEKFRKHLLLFKDTVTRFNQIYSILVLVNFLISTFVMIIPPLVSFYLVSVNKIAVGNGAIVFFLLQFIKKELFSVIDFQRNLYFLKPIADKLYSFFSKNVQSVLYNNSEQLKITNLTCILGDKKILNNITKTFYPGDFVLLLGKSGCGKTTLLNNIANLIPYSGEIRFPLSSTHEELINYISHKNPILSDTLYNNITFGKDVGVERIRQLLSDIDQEDFVNFFESGFDTLIGQGYQKVSGGQMQIINLLRSIINNKFVQILDEPFSHVDIKLGKKMLNKLKETSNKKITIISSHSLEYASLCNRILVLDNGEVIEDGDFNDLLNKRNEFYRLYKIRKLQYEKK